MGGSLIPRKVCKSERLTTLGTLAAEIAHEIRNPLMVVRLLFDSLKLGDQEDENKLKDISVIREKLNLWNKLGRILEFGKVGNLFAKWSACVRFWRMQLPGPFKTGAVSNQSMLG